MTGIRHAFSATQADGGDTSLLRPSDWNAEHIGGISCFTSFPLVHTGGVSAQIWLTYRALYCLDNGNLNAQIVVTNYLGAFYWQFYIRDTMIEQVTVTGNGTWNMTQRAMTKGQAVRYAVQSGGGGNIAGAATLAEGMV